MSGAVKVAISIALVGISVLAESAPVICEHVREKRAKKEQKMRDMENNCIDVEWHFC